MVRTYLPTSVWGLTALFALMVTMTVLSILARDRAFFAWDVTVAGWVMDIPGPGVSSLMGAVSWPGAKTSIVATVLAATALATWALGWRAGLLVVFVLVIAGLNEEFKEVIGRPRPGELETLGNKSFPSGHALYAVLVTGTTWLLVSPRLSKGSHRMILAGTLVAWVLLTGLSRIYLEKHWPSDVLGSYVLGASIVLVMAWAVPVLERFQWPSRTPANPEGEAS